MFFDQATEFLNTSQYSDALKLDSIISHPLKDVDLFSQKSTSLESSEHDSSENLDSFSRGSYLSSHFSPKYTSRDQHFNHLDDLIHHFKKSYNSEDHKNENHETHFGSQPKPTKSSESTLKQYKTRICTFWLAGKCKRGSACCWAHGDKDQRSVPDTRKTTICKNWISGICPHQNDPSNCTFAHGEDDLKKLRGRLFLCRENEKGECPKGKDCPYAHSLQELWIPPVHNEPIAPAKNENQNEYLHDQNYNIVDFLKGLRY